MSAPRSRDRATRSSSCTTRTAARPAVHARGLPPNVDVCISGFSENTFSHTDAVPMVAPIGMTPPPSCLASVMMSGATPSWSQANIAPVRPMQVCTSSAIMSAPVRSHASRIARR